MPFGYELNVGKRLWNVELGCVSGRGIVGGRFIVCRMKSVWISIKHNYFVSVLDGRKLSAFKNLGCLDMESGCIELLRRYFYLG